MPRSLASRRTAPSRVAVSVAATWLTLASAATAAPRATVPQSPGTAVSACTDVYDPNESCAGTLATLGSGTYSGLVESGFYDTADADWYKVHLRLSERLIATVTYTTPAGNAELALETSCFGTILADDIGGGLVRTFTYTNAGADADFFMVSAHYDNATCRTYSLSIAIVPTGNVDNTTTPPGWSAPLVPRSDNTATTASCSPTATLHGNTTDTYFNWVFYQRGPTNLPPYDYGVYVDDIVLSGYEFGGPVLAYDYYVINNGAHTVLGGRHTVKSVSDAASVTPETNEFDNSYTAQFIWSPLVLGEGAPVVRTVPPLSQGPQVFPLVNADGFQYTHPATVAWVVSEAPRNAYDDDDLAVFDDYSGTSAGFSNAIGNSRWGGNATDFVVGHFLGTPATVHPAVNCFTVGGGGGSFAIDAIGAYGRNGVPDGNNSYTGQTLGPNRLADVYEAYLTSGTRWYFTLRRRSGNAVLRFEIYPGTSGVVSRRGLGTASSALMSTSPDVEVFGPYTSTETGWHPIVVYRDNGTNSDQPVTYDFAWNSVGYVDVSEAPQGHSLEFLGAMPNPLDAKGSFAFVLPASGRASLAVFDLGGRRICSLADGVFGAGRQSVTWDGRDESGARLGAGMYWARFEAAGQTFTRPVVLVH